ncbi:MAG TPA: hypothetical protein VJU18_05670 [Vicinamibacteria bacterium]|nr:hypothetical protein [Vicinamibacteria bacterium]
MESIWVLLLAACSSLLLWLWGRYRLRLTPSGLIRALALTLESLGWAVTFYAINLVLGVALTALVRATSGRFLSLYPTADPVLFLLSLLQALLFSWWRRQG